MPQPQQLQPQPPAHGSAGAGGAGAIPGEAGAGGAFAGVNVKEWLDARAVTRQRLAEQVLHVGRLDRRYGMYSLHAQECMY